MSNSLLMSPARGPCSWWRHAAGAPDLHVEIVGERLDGLADRAAEMPAAVAGRRRILDDVDRQRNHLARPRRRLPEHQRQRHGQAMVDVHPVDDRHVELVEDRRLRDVPGELRMALDDRHRPRAPAFVGGRERFGAADREGRNDLERERRRMIVVDQDDDVRLRSRDPLLRELVALEHRLPIGLRRSCRGRSPRRSPGMCDVATPAVIRPCVFAPSAGCGCPPPSGRPPSIIAGVLVLGHAGHLAPRAAGTTCRRSRRSWRGNRCCRRARSCGCSRARAPPASAPRVIGHRRR